MMIERPLLNIMACAAIALTAASPIANAELLTYEDFDYPAEESLATSYIAGDSGGVGWDDSWTTPMGISGSVSSSGLAYTSVKPTYHGLEPGGNALVLTKDMNNRRKFDTKPAGVYGNQGCCGTDAHIGGEGAKGSLYGSILISDTNWTKGGRVLFEFLGSNPIRIQQLVRGGGFHITDSSNEILDNVPELAGFNDAQTILLVWKFDFEAGSGADNLTVWINPSEEHDPSISLVSKRDISFNGLEIREIFYDTNGNLILDEIRLGTSWDDVVPKP